MPLVFDTETVVAEKVKSRVISLICLDEKNMRADVSYDDFDVNGIYQSSGFITVDDPEYSQILIDLAAALNLMPHGTISPMDIKKGLKDRFYNNLSIQKPLGTNSIT